MSALVINKAFQPTVLLRWPVQGVLFAIALAIGVSSCALRSFKLYPSVQGVVTKSGKPLANAMVELEVNALNSVLKQVAYTDERGEFQFPESSKFAVYGPHRHVAYQKLTIAHAGVKYGGLHGERDYIKDFEQGLKIRFVCDIDSAPKERTSSGLNGSWYSNTSNYRYVGLCAS